MNERSKSSARGASEKPAGAMLMPMDRIGRSGPPPIFRNLTPSEVESIVQESKQLIIYRGESLFKQGAPQDGIYVVETGRIKVFYVDPSGREITLAYWHSGNFVGGPDVFEGGNHVWSGKASPNSRLLHIPGVTLRKKVKDIPSLAINVIEGLSFKGRCYSALAQMLGTNSPAQRLAYLISHLGDLYGLDGPEGRMIEAQFSHAALAGMIGVTRQAVTTNLKRFAELGIIALDSAGIIVKKPHVLDEIKSGFSSF